MAHGSFLLKYIKNVSRYFDYLDVPSELAFIPQQGDTSQDVTFKKGGMPAVVSKKGG